MRSLPRTELCPRAAARRRLRTLPPIVCFLLAKQLASQETVLHLRVVESTSGSPVAGVRIGRDSLGAPIGVTDSTGRVVVRASGEHGARFFVTRIGFSPARIEISEAQRAAAEIVIALEQVGMELRPVMVTAPEFKPLSPRLMGFEKRMASKHKNGYFFAAAEVRRRNVIRLPDLMRVLPSLDVVDSAGTRMVVSRRMVKPSLAGPTRMQTREDPSSWGAALKYCPLQVFIDGNPKEWGFPLDNVEPSEVHGVEVYLGPATVPAEFNSARKDGWCGALLVWTKDR